MIGQFLVLRFRSRSRYLVRDGLSRLRKRVTWKDVTWNLEYVLTVRKNSELCLCYDGFLTGRECEILFDFPFFSFVHSLTGSV